MFKRGVRTHRWDLERSTLHGAVDEVDLQHAADVVLARVNRSCMARDGTTSPMSSSLPSSCLRISASSSLVSTVMAVFFRLGADLPCVSGII